MADKGKPLPFHLRQRVREYRQRGISERRTARLLELHRATVKKYSQKFVPPSQNAA